MNSSMHSSDITPSDVVILPSINNHINHNHTESASKSLKRSRSPSLTRDDNNESSQSSITNTDSPTKKSRKRRTTTEIDQSLGFVFFILILFLLKIHILSWLLEHIYLQINYIFIDGQQVNRMLICMYYKNKYVIIYLLNHLNENILV